MGLMHRLENFFGKPYDLFFSVIDELNGHIIDLGSSDGGVARRLPNCIVECIDTDAKALGEIKAKNATIHCDDIKRFVRSYQGKVDAIVINNTLHEIIDPSNQQEDSRRFFASMDRITGKIVVGDYYYPTYLKDEEVEKFCAAQLLKTGHADPRNNFIQSYIVKRTAKESGFKIKYFNDIRSVADFDKRYYIFLLEK